MNIFPVFLNTESLEFYLNARHTHKQLLTVLNPYDYCVNFQVLCTSPTKFSVIDSEGMITPRSCIDLIVRYTQPSDSHCDTVSKFRITVSDSNTERSLGHTDVLLKVIEGEPSNTHQESFGENFQPMSIKAAPIVKPTTEEHSRVTFHHKTHREPQKINLVSVALSICCIAALLLPTQSECVVTSQWPDWIHISPNLKIIFSFVLGLICMLVLRP